jgi:hypothetical protein
VLCSHTFADVTKPISTYDYPKTAEAGSATLACHLDVSDCSVTFLRVLNFNNFMPSA